MVDSVQFDGAMVVGGRGEVTGEEIHRGDAEARRRELATDGAAVLSG